VVTHILSFFHPYLGMMMMMMMMMTMMMMMMMMIQLWFLKN